MHSGDASVSAEWNAKFETLVRFLRRVSVTISLYHVSYFHVPVGSGQVTLLPLLLKTARE